MIIPLHQSCKWKTQSGKFSFVPQSKHLQVIFIVWQSEALCLVTRLWLGSQLIMDARERRREPSRCLVLRGREKPPLWHHNGYKIWIVKHWTLVNCMMVERHDGRKDCFESSTFQNTWMFPKMMCNVGAWCQEVPSVHRLVYTCTQGNSWDDGLVLAVRTDRNLWPQHCHNQPGNQGSHSCVLWPQLVASWWSSSAALFCCHVTKSWLCIQTGSEVSQVIGHGHLLSWGTMPRCRVTIKRT